MTATPITLTPTADVASGDTGPGAWMLSALCAQVDPEAFFPEKGGSTATAKRVCAACPVKAECLAYALADPHMDGVWAGTTVRERRQMRREMEVGAA